MGYTRLGRASFSLSKSSIDTTDTVPSYASEARSMIPLAAVEKSRLAAERLNGDTRDPRKLRHWALREAASAEGQQDVLAVDGPRANPDEHVYQHASRGYKTAAAVEGRSQKGQWKEAGNIQSE
jgi:hypothetical protein